MFTRLQNLPGLRTTTNPLSSDAGTDPKQHSSRFDIVDSPPSSRHGKFAQSRHTRPRLFWICIGALIFLVIAIPALVCGLYFGLRHSKSHAITTVSLVVDLEYSKYQGSHVDNGITEWLGIRYAAAPVGDLRFRAPVDPPLNDTLQIANKHGSSCLSSPSTALDPTKSEDCLFLDVYAPTNSSGSHAVFVFFQGGGFNSNANPNLNANKLINGGDRDIVVVTFNYRVGVYGFLSGNEVKADGDLNVGLLDQRKVLEWVQANIEQFGGDPNRVTIGGASAGAASIALHMSAYNGRDDNLFHAVAAESQSFGHQLTLSESQYQYDALAKRLNCTTSANTLKCLRDAPIQVLAAHNIDIPPPGAVGGRKAIWMWSPVIDGNFTTDHTYTLFYQGKFVKVPSIFGDTTNEGTVFTPAKINSTADMHAFLTENFPGLTEAQLAKIDELYPKGAQFPGKGSYWRTAADAFGEMRYVCPGLYISRAIAAKGEKSWNYRWNVLSSSNAASGLGVPHAITTGSIWGTSGAPDSALTPTIQNYWTSFIRSGDPNTFKLEGAPRWEGFGEGEGRVVFQNQVADTSMENVPADQRGRCEFWSGIGVGLGQ